MRLGHVSTRPGNAIVYVQSVGEHWVVHCMELALAGGCLPSGTHDQPIVDVDVWWWLWGRKNQSFAVLRYWAHGPSRTTPRQSGDNTCEKRYDGVLGACMLSTFHKQRVAQWQQRPCIPGFSLGWRGCNWTKHVDEVDQTLSRPWLCECQAPISGSSCCRLWTPGNRTCRLIATQLR